MQVVKIFTQLGIEIHTFDVREDEEIWNNIRYYHNHWYILQLHLRGEYVFSPVDVLDAYNDGNLGNWLESWRVQPRSNCKRKLKVGQAL